MSRLIWIDLDNSPHVPFFLPIIAEIERRGHSVIVTAREAYQVRDLADQAGLAYTLVGRHYGKKKALKVYGVLSRAMKLYWLIRGKKPALALNHGSRAQTLIANIMRIPVVAIMDYEHGEGVPFVWLRRILTPELVPASMFGRYQDCVRHYPGIKEDVYVSSLQPDPTILTELGIENGHIVVTMRPPATVAHYHNPESEVLFDAAMRFLLETPDVQTVILPRTPHQTKEIRQSWAEGIASGKFIIPKRAVPGLNLLWHSDVAISGGGTMNREAAVLGVPVYSIFRGKIGAVDQHLSDTGRLILLHSAEEVRKKVRLVRRSRPDQSEMGNPEALHTIVNEILSML